MLRACSITVQAAIFFAMRSTYFMFQLNFSCNGPTTEGKESGQEVEW